MSRSFVRAWATVATIMAMACFAFVEPMPDAFVTPMGGTINVSDIETDAPTGPGIAADSGDQLSPTAPFVDSTLTGKTFTPYLAADEAPPLNVGAGQLILLANALQDPRVRERDPLIRPG